MAHFAADSGVEIAWLGCNRISAGVFERAAKYGVPAEHFSRTELNDGTVAARLAALHIDWIALAGFLLKVPPSLVSAFTGRMVNIHPALLPRYGGPGMYGMHVHEAVAQSSDTESGPTIHWVTSEYDEGATIFQATAPLDPTDDASDIARKVLALEHRYYPEVLGSLIHGLPVKKP